MEKHEKINLWFGGVGLLISIIAIIVAYKSCASSESIAEKSGAFNKPNIYLSFGNFDIGDDTVKLIYGLNFNDSGLNLGTFPFQINNGGKKNGEDIKILIEYPKIAHIGITDSNLIHNPVPTLADAKRETISQDNLDIVGYKIAEINPGLRITIDEPFVLHKTEVLSSINLQNGETQSFLIKYSFIFSVTLMGNDLPTQKIIFKVACFNTDNIDKITDEYVSSLKREKGKKDFTFFILPQKKTSLIEGKYLLNEYEICNKCLYLAYIDDTSPNRDIILGLYNQDNKIEKVKAYNKENKVIADMNPK